MSTPLYEEIIAQRGRLENLMSRVPGFKGYHAKEARRQADTLLREHLAKEISSIIREYDSLMNKLLDGGKGLKHMSRAREVKSKLQAYHDKIDAAAPKYSGMFAQVKITEDILERLYAFDEAQFRYLTQFDVAMNEFRTAIESGENIEEAMEKIYDVADTAIRAFELRDDEILQIGDSKL